MRPQNEQLIQVILEGKAEAQRKALTNQLDEHEELREFANRMLMRLHWAAERIQELEQASINQSWAGDVDRQGGAFSADEIARSAQEKW